MSIAADTRFLSHISILIFQSIKWQLEVDNRGKEVLVAILLTGAKKRTFAPYC
eukprot:COSAG02_NODE_55252_length_291_cov_1.260417_2_plen_53_part_01